MDAPRASLLLLAYNQAATVEAAARSCLAQQCEPIEIVLSDDGSSDATHALLQRIAAAYRGPHRVSVRRNAVNAGIGAHYNQLLAASQGALLVTAAGDDVSHPDRVQRLLQAWDATGQRADLVASHVGDLDAQGTVHGTLRVDDLAAWRGVEDWARRRPHVIGAGHAFTRRLMQRFGPLAAGVFYEDQVMAFRAIVSGGAVTVDAPLLDYRRGGTSASAAVRSAAQFLAAQRGRTARRLAELDQLLRDGDTAGCGDAVRAALAQPLAEERYLRALLDARDNAERRSLCRSARHLPLGWRLRKCLQLSHPGLHVALRRR